MQACQQMCEVLIEAGIDHVFGIPGGGTSPCSMPSTTIATRSASSSPGMSRPRRSWPMCMAA